MQALDIYQVESLIYICEIIMAFNQQSIKIVSTVSFVATFVFSFILCSCVSSCSANYELKNI